MPREENPGNTFRPVAVTEALTIETVDRNLRSIPEEADPIGQNFLKNYTTVLPILFKVSVLRTVPVFVSLHFFMKINGKKLRNVVNTVTDIYRERERVLCRHFWYLRKP